MVTDVNECLLVTKKNHEINDTLFFGPTVETNAKFFRVKP